MPSLCTCSNQLQPHDRMTVCPPEPRPKFVVSPRAQTDYRLIVPRGRRQESE